MAISPEVAELNRARDEILVSLDEKFRNIPEWKAFRAIDRAIHALTSQASVREIVIPELKAVREGRSNSYSSLAIMALNERKHPITSDEYLEFVSKFRTVDLNDRKAKASITSTLSKDPRFKNIAWGDGTAWWFADRPLPRPDKL